MKNIGSKILILGFVIAVAVAGVLVFYPTIVKPPVDVAMNNPHTANAEATIGDFVENVNDIAHNDSLFYAMVDKLEVYRLEKYLTEDELDKQTLSLVRSYVPIFIKWCNSKFGERTWNAKEDHPRMQQRIADVRALTIGPENARVTAVSDVHEDDLEYVETVIRDYNKATEVARSYSFVSVDKANKTIKEANKYLNTEPLDNCEDLVKKLSEVKVKIGKSHYAKVEAKVEEMARYRYMTEDSFNALKETAKSMIDEYDSNRYNYGRDAKTSDDLLIKFDEYSDNANDYYIQEYVSVNPNGQWRSMSTPNSSYMAYESFSNYWQPSSNATMSFTIRGYSEYTFYIRSNGESGCDYVMVGLDREPTTSNNIANTSYGSSSGESVSSYKRVYIPNLNEEQYYTIYVVYRKDNSYSYDPDRGYVLIPYAN